MDDAPIEWHRPGYVVSTDRSRLEVGATLDLLRTTHWAGGLTRDQLARAIRHSVCFGVYADEVLVGFGRVVTDLATYGYLTDVVVAPGHRGRGLGRWLTECVLAHPELRGFRRLALITRDAAELYRPLGFRVGPGSLIYMEHIEPARDPR